MFQHLSSLLRRPKAPSIDLQAAADVAAWRQLLRRRPDLAERIRLALAAGRSTDSVIAGAADAALHSREHTKETGAEPRQSPRLALLLPCAVHGCARSLGLLAPSRAV
jgi:hypothetical protein